MFFPKQLGFQVNNSTHHAILNLADDILTSFEKGQFIFGVLLIYQMLSTLLVIVSLWNQR